MGKNEEDRNGWHSGNLKRQRPAFFQFCISFYQDVCDFLSSGIVNSFFCLIGKQTFNTLEAQPEITNFEPLHNYSISTVDNISDFRT